jgi:phage shock protein A
MGRFFRALRGFFGSLLTGAERRNPEILPETAVQDELNNLKKLQVAAARTMAYEKMLANDAASKQKVVTVKERQSRELAARGQRDAAIEVVQQKQEAQTQLAEIEARIEEARKNSEEMEQAFRDQERRYNEVVRERAALMEEHQRARASARPTRPAPTSPSPAPPATWNRPGGRSGRPPTSQRPSATWGPAKPSDR